MRASRGMGDINPAKIKAIRKKDGNEPVTIYKAGGKVSPAEYAATTKAKRKGKAAGKQFVAQPKGVAKKAAGYR